MARTDNLVISVGFKKRSINGVISVKALYQWGDFSTSNYKGPELYPLTVQS